MGRMQKRRGEGCVKKVRGKKYLECQANTRRCGELCGDDAEGCEHRECALQLSVAAV